MSELHKDIPDDPQVSALYREHARDEPPAAVDEHILATARAAVSAAASVAQRSWWQRWRTTLALATTLALTLSLALLHERPPGNPQREAGVAPARPVAPASGARDTAAPAAPPTAVSEHAAAAAGKAAGVAPRLPAREDQLAGPHVAPAAGAGGPLPAAGDAPRQGGSPAIARQEADTGSAPPRAREGSAVAGTAATAAAAAGASAEQEAAAAGQAPAARQRARAEAPSRAGTARSADDWLDEIRALRRAGRSAEAAKQLADFRLAHPDYPLPEEFRQ